MSMFVPGFGILSAGMALLVVSAAHGEEIYKWVDKDGRTHYSARKEDAGDARPTSLKVDAAPPVPAASAASAQAWPGQDAMRKRAQLDAADPRFAVPPANQRPRTPPVDYRDESAASKCQLARDILSGAAKHHNGAPVDAYDRQVAQNDFRTFCGK